MPDDSSSAPKTPTTSSRKGAPKAAAAANKTEKASERDRASRRTPVKLDSPRWLAPVMVAMFIIGLAWIVAYYVAPGAPVIATLGWWNVVIGFGFFAVGFFLSTRWR